MLVHKALAEDAFPQITFPSSDPHSQVTTNASLPRSKLVADILIPVASQPTI